MEQVIEQVDSGILYLSIVGLVISIYYSIKYKHLYCKHCPYFLSFMLYTQIFYTVSATIFSGNKIISDISDLNYDTVFFIFPLLLMFCNFFKEDCKCH